MRSLGDGAGEDGERRISPLERKKVISRGSRGYDGSVGWKISCGDQRDVDEVLDVLLRLEVEYSSSKPRTSFHLLPRFD